MVLQSHYSWNRPPKPLTFRHSPFTLPPAAPRKKAHPDTSLHPCTLESYPPQWQEVIGCAIHSFHAYIADQHRFPDAVSGVQEGRKCLQDAIKVHAEEGGMLEPGMYESDGMLYKLTRQIGYTITREMAMLVHSCSY